MRPAIGPDVLACRSPFLVTRSQQCRASPSCHQHLCVAPRPAQTGCFLLPALGPASSGWPAVWFAKVWRAKSLKAPIPARSRLSQCKSSLGRNPSTQASSASLFYSETWNLMSPPHITKHCLPAFSSLSEMQKSSLRPQTAQTQAQATLALQLSGLLILPSSPGRTEDPPVFPPVFTRLSAGSLLGTGEGDAACHLGPCTCS